MAKVIGIMGESGSGKTTSMQNLDPKTTFYIDTDKKGLSWKGWRKQYNIENRNYARTDKPNEILRLLNKINKEEKHVMTIIIDTLNGIMVGDEMRRAKEKGYDKWIDLSRSVWEIVDAPLSFRDNLTVIFIAHSQTVRDDYGNVFTNIKTNGKKLEKVVLESKMTTVLHSVCKEGKYIFYTKSNNSTCKTPMGAFDVDEIENDITIVLEALKEY